MFTKNICIFRVGDDVCYILIFISAIYLHLAFWYILLEPLDIILCYFTYF